jgi:hypothetical protein
MWKTRLFALSACGQMGGKKTIFGGKTDFKDFNTDYTVVTHSRFLKKACFIYPGSFGIHHCE